MAEGKEKALRGKKITAEQMLSRIYNMTRGMVSPSYVESEKKQRQPKPKKAYGGKTKKAKGMKRGGKMKAKGMAKGGAAKKMANGGKAMMRKSKGMKRGGKMKKSKGMARGGKAKR